MTSAALLLSRESPGTQPRAVEERAGDALRLLWGKLPRRGNSEDVPNGEKGPRGLEGQLSPPGGPPADHLLIFFSF